MTTLIVDTIGELRRRVMLRARMRAICGWSDACILNVSSRVLMINSATLVKGNTVEVWHGEHVIVATVVWRKGTRAGLQAEERIPVEEILALGKSPGLQLTAGTTWPEVERRKKPRGSDEHRITGRALEYTGVLFLGAILAISAFLMVEQAFARPLHYVAAAFGG